MKKAKKILIRLCRLPYLLILMLCLVIVWLYKAWRSAKNRIAMSRLRADYDKETSKLKLKEVIEILQIKTNYKARIEELQRKRLEIRQMPDKLIEKINKMWGYE